MNPFKFCGARDNTRRNELRRRAKRTALIVGTATIILALGALLAGCVTSPDLQGDPAAVNKRLNETIIADKAGVQIESDLTLLNIVRASRDETRYYINVQSWLEGLPTYSSSLSGGLGFPLQLSGAVKRNSGTSGATIQPLVTQEFERGITTPISPQLFAYFYDQGYPLSLLLHLFVRKIDVYQHDKLIREYVNSPTSPKLYAQFDALANALAACRLVDGVDNSEINANEVIGPAVATSAATSLERQVDVLSKGFVIVSIKGKGKQGKYHFYLVKQNPPSLTFENYPEASLMSTFSNYCDIGRHYAALQRSSGNPLQFAQGPIATTATPPMSMELRSPEATLYYLGQVLRLQMLASPPPLTGSSKKQMPLSAALELGQAYLKKKNEPFTIGIASYDVNNVTEEASSGEKKHGTEMPSCSTLFGVLRSPPVKSPPPSTAAPQVTSAVAQTVPPGGESGKDNKATQNQSSSSWQWPPPGGCFAFNNLKVPPPEKSSSSPKGKGEPSASTTPVPASSDQAELAKRQPICSLAGKKPPSPLTRCLTVIAATPPGTSSMSASIDAPIQAEENGITYSLQPYLPQIGYSDSIGTTAVAFRLLEEVINLQTNTSGLPNTTVVNVMH